MFFGFFAHADVANRGCNQDAFGAFQWAEHDLDREFAAILAQSSELDAGANLLRQGVFHGAFFVGNQPFRKALGNDVFHALPYKFVAPVPELFLGLHVQQDNVSLLIHHHHRVRSRFQQPAVTPFHARQMLFGFFAHADIANRRGHQNSFGAF